MQWKRISVCNDDVTILGSLTNRIFLASATLAVLSIGAAVYFVSLTTTREAEAELQRAKDHLKGSLMLNLESTSSRMSHLARQEIYGETGETADAMLAAIEEVTAADVYRLGQQFLAPGALGVTVLGDVDGLTVTSEQLALS